MSDIKLKGEMSMSQLIKIVLSSLVCLTFAFSKEVLLEKITIQGNDYQTYQIRIYQVETPKSEASHYTYMNIYDLNNRLVSRTPMEMDLCTDQTSFIQQYDKGRLSLICSQSDHINYQYIVMNGVQIKDIVYLFQENPIANYVDGSIYINQYIQYYFPQGGKTFLLKVLKYSPNRIGFLPSYDAYSVKEYEKVQQHYEQLLDKEITEKTNHYEYLLNVLYTLASINDISRTCEVIKKYQHIKDFQKFENIVLKISDIPQLNISSCK